MNVKSLLFSLLLIGLLLAQSPVHYTWPDINAISGTEASTMTRHLLKNWKLQEGQNGPRQVELPLLLKTNKQLIFTTTFHLPQDLPPQTEIKLVTQNIHGACYFYINNHLLGVSPNSLNPWRLKIPEEYFKQDSVLNITLKIKPVQSADAGFPNIVYVLSEEHFLGPGAAVYLEVTQKPTIILKKLNLLEQDNQFLLHYQYQIETSSPIQSFKIEESLRRLSDGQTFFKKQRFSRETRTATLLLEGTVPLALSNLWTTKEPRLLTFSVQGQVSTKQGKQSFTFRQKFGARTFKIQKQKFYLNNQPFQVRGIALHLSPEIFKGRHYLQSLTEMLSFVKKLQFNAIRLSHYLPDQALLSLCDSLGILVFAEFPIWRFPKEFFAENYLLEAGKHICQQIRPFYLSHPSLAAIGLGQEIPLHLPSAQKFIFILNGKLKENLHVLTYISPIPGFPLPPESVSNFYLYDRYQPVHFLEEEANQPSFALFGKIGLLTSDLLMKKSADESHQINRSLLIKNEIFKALKDFQPNGGFVECLHDWFTEYPNDFGIDGQPGRMVPHGFLNVRGEAKSWVKLLGNPWQTDDATLLQDLQDQKPRTNFFSLLMTFSVILFFAIYRRAPRLRENFWRSLRHSYGFFVDLRERRIIPLFNSITIALIISMVASVFLASQIYFFHKSLWLQEIMAIFLIPLGVFERYLQLSQNKILITLFFLVLFTIVPFAGAFLLKILAWANRAKIRFRQGLATISWAGAPLIWFFPVSLVSYHFLLFHYPLKWLWIGFAIFILWVQIRLINGIHILFIARTSKVFVILMLCYFIPILIFWALFNPPNYWVDYLQLMINAQSLF